jgi:hypothetical protein
MYENWRVKPVQIVLGERELDGGGIWLRYFVSTRGNVTRYPSLSHASNPQLLGRLRLGELWFEVSMGKKLHLNQWWCVPAIPAS